MERLIIHSGCLIIIKYIFLEIKNGEKIGKKGGRDGKDESRS